MHPVGVALLVTALAFAVVGMPVANSDSSQCTSCNLVVEVAHDLLGSETFDDCIVDVLAFACSTLGFFDHWLCRGRISEYEDAFAYVLAQLVVEPKDICGLLVRGCDGGFDPYNGTWVLDMPGIKPPHKEPPAVPEGKPRLRVLHLSDIHVDNDYLPGAEIKCGEPCCCRPPRDGNEAKDVLHPAGYWSSIGECDAPYWLFEDMMRNIADKHKDIDYVVVSGDLESHADWDYTKAAHQEKIRNVSRTIKKYLPGLPVYFAVGNHEGIPLGTFAPHWTPDKFHMDYLYDTMATEWQEWVPAEQLPTVRYNGCFMKQLYPGLRLISLNNGYGDSANFFLYVNQTDPDGTMTWLLEQLEDAERHGDKVQIVAHIPGNDLEALEGWAFNYNLAVNRFEDTIVAQFFGHTHSEEFYVTYENPNDASSRPTSVIFSAPSVTSYSDFFPAYRLYTIDGNYPGSSFQIIDFEEIYLNLTEANADPTAPTHWKQLYKSAKAEYGLDSMQAPQWSKLIDRMADDDQLLAKYVKNFYRRFDMPCNDECRFEMLCTARQAHHSLALCKDLEQKLAPQFERKKSTEARILLKSKTEAKQFVQNLPSFTPTHDKCKIGY